MLVLVALGTPPTLDLLQIALVVVAIVDTQLERPAQRARESLQTRDTTQAREARGVILAARSRVRLIDKTTRASNGSARLPVALLDGRHATFPIGRDHQFVAKPIPNALGQRRLQTAARVAFLHRWGSVSEARHAEPLNQTVRQTQHGRLGILMPSRRTGRGWVVVEIAGAVLGLELEALRGRRLG